MSAIVGVAIDASRIVGDISGIPGIGTAASCVQAIHDRCNQVVSHKKECQLLANQAAVLLQALRTYNVEVDQLRAAADEVTFVLRSVYDRLEVWASYSRVRAFLNDGKVSDGIRKCEADLNTAISKFHITSNITVANAQRMAEAVQAQQHEEVMQLQRQNNENLMEFKALLLKVLPQDDTIATELGRTSTPTPQQLMEAGQHVLTSRGDPEATTTKEQVMEVERLLSELRNQTGVKSSVPVLDKQVERVGKYPLEKGGTSEIYLGRWLGREKVALKVLRTVLVSPRARDHFAREIKVWSKLDHPNVLPLLGIVTDIGYFVQTVAPYMENGSILEYAARNKDANRPRLLCGAAKGLAYLHEQGVVHGNVRCSNILITDKVEACICDFGMAKIIGDITDSVPSATLTQTGSTRWLAPELIFDASCNPSPATDVWSFGMTMLECFTLRPPWREVKREAHVVRRLSSEVTVRPLRAIEAQDLTDDIWRMMMMCWEQDPAQRCSLTAVAECLDGSVAVA
ncbi:TKL/TKL-ccin protein kinase [Wolfiporia cocos MD-104 SS10]|uniref:TKL/TKL-ccin protein kinase n=1 Tax=Wolfiporia cocos (strain MD-104) TaxID=742152 RepID=A0A2H3JES3_WOLCO|nr:TKL/TKL-ccin protein kinase [Wolfiporia cocos MD-104 SS10]